MFQTLYSKPCKAALATWLRQRRDQTISSARLLELAQQKFTSSFKALEVGPDDAVALHRRFLRRLKGHWRHRHGARTCFVCLVAPSPEFRLMCGHRLCHHCVQVEGERTSRAPNIYLISYCPLCGTSLSTTSIGMVPRLAGLRVLGIDGGGCRGIISLEYFAALERRSGIPWFGHHNFDVVVGSSTGARFSMTDISRVKGEHAD